MGAASSVPNGQAKINSNSPTIADGNSSANALSRFDNYGGDNVQAGQELFNKESLGGAPATHTDLQGRFSNTAEGNGPVVTTGGASNVHSATGGNDRQLQAGGELFDKSVLDGPSATHRDTDSGKISNSRDFNGPVVDTQGSSNLHPTNAIDSDAVVSGKSVYNKDVLEGAPATHPDLQGKPEGLASGHGLTTELPHGAQDITKDGDKVIAGKEVFPVELTEDETTRHPMTSRYPDNETSAGNGGHVTKTEALDSRPIVSETNDVKTSDRRVGEDLVDPSLNTEARKYPETRTTDIADSAVTSSNTNTTNTGNGGMTVVDNGPLGAKAVATDAQGNPQTKPKKGKLMQRIKAFIKPDFY